LREAKYAALDIFFGNSEVTGLRLSLILARRGRELWPAVDLKLLADERLGSFFSSEPETEQVALAFQVDVKIKKGTALAFGHNPGRIGELFLRAASSFIATKS
jgi:hypothetical protein